MVSCYEFFVIENTNFCEIFRIEIGLIGWKLITFFGYYSADPLVAVTTKIDFVWRPELL